MVAYYFPFPSRLRHDNDLLHTPLSWLFNQQIGYASYVLVGVDGGCMHGGIFMYSGICGVAWTSDCIAFGFGSVHMLLYTLLCLQPKSLPESERQST